MSTLRSLLGLALVLGALGTARPARGEDVPTFADRSDETVDDVTRSASFMISPLALASGVFGAEADFVLAKHLALAIEGDVYQLTAAPAVALGVGLLIYPLRSAFHGPYLEPRAVFARSLGESPIEVDWNTDVAGVGGTLGWQWSWDTGFSVRFGGGAMEYLGGSVTSVPQGAVLAVGQAEVVIDASLGWAF